MPNVTVINRNSVARVVDMPEGVSLMENLRDHGFDEIMALCGGVCSCATCHVYILRGAPGVATARSEDEADLLSLSSHIRDNSRLSCQIELTSAMEGMVVEIAPED